MKKKLLFLILIHTIHLSYSTKEKCEIALIEATIYGNYEAVNQLLHYNICNPNDIDPVTGKTALHFASEYGFFNITTNLLSHGADPNIPSHDIYYPYPLHLAVISANIKIVELLLLHGANPNNYSPVNHKTALHKAAEIGHEKITELLLIAGANKKLKDTYGNLAIDYAKRNNWEKIVILLS